MDDELRPGDPVVVGAAGVTEDALFPDDGLRRELPPELTAQPDETAGARLRRRQAGQIASGYHPLALATKTLRLHPDAPRPLSREQADAYGGPAAYPSCGTCRFRVLFGGHARPYPKCVFGKVDRDMDDEELAARSPLQVRFGVRRVYRVPRASHSEATDVRAWWPGCTDWEPYGDEREEGGRDAG